MNIAKSPDLTSSHRSSRFWTCGAFVLLWAIFYFAAPMNVRFTTGATFNAVNGDVSSEERAEINVDANAQGNLGRELSLITLAIFGACCLALPAERRVKLQGLSGVLIVGFLAWALMSIVWSGEPITTLRKQTVLFCLAAAALGIAKQFSLRQIVYFTVFAATLQLIVGLLSEMAIGTFQPLDADYRFSGLTWPAFNAWMLALLILGAAVLYPTSTKYRTALLLLSVAALCAVVMTKTRAGAAALMAGLAVYVTLTWPLRRTLLALLTGVTCTAAAILALSLITPNAGDTLIDVVNLGRADSAEGVSGRSQLWEDLVPFIETRPLFGYGYDSFWTPDHLIQIGEDNWGAPDAHNGYINLTLGVGLIGAVAYILMLLAGFCRSLACSLKTGSAEYAFVCGAIVVSVVNTGFVATQLAPTLYTFVTLALLAHIGFIDDRNPDAVRIS